MNLQQFKISKLKSYLVNNYPVDEIKNIVKHPGEYTLLISSWGLHASMVRKSAVLALAEITGE